MNRICFDVGFGTKSMKANLFWLIWPFRAKWLAKNNGERKYIFGVTIFIEKKKEIKICEDDVERSIKCRSMQCRLGNCDLHHQWDNGGNGSKAILPHLWEGVLLRRIVLWHILAHHVWTRRGWLGMYIYQLLVRSANSFQGWRSESCVWKWFENRIKTSNLMSIWIWVDIKNTLYAFSRSWLGMYLILASISNADMFWPNFLFTNFCFYPFFADKKKKKAFISPFFPLMVDHSFNRITTWSIKYRLIECIEL